MHALPLRSLPLLVLALAVAGLSALAAPTAHAAGDGGYRYWSFWLQKDPGTSTWSYATEGPATQRPEDGDTLGFRFGLSEDSKNAKKPRGDTSFTTACADTAKKSGTKRVALRLDFGTGDDAPKGGSGKDSPPEPRTECARIDEKATAAEALAAVAEPLRYSSDSMLCAIEGYPAKGCGEQVTGSGDSGDDSDSSDSSDSQGNKDGNAGEGAAGDDGTMSTGLGLTAGIAAVAVLGAAALWQARRRRQ